MNGIEEISEEYLDIAKHKRIKRAPQYSIYHSIHKTRFCIPMYSSLVMVFFYMILGIVFLGIATSKLFNIFGRGAKIRAILLCECQKVLLTGLPINFVSKFVEDGFPPFMMLHALFKGEELGKNFSIFLYSLLFFTLFRTSISFSTLS